MTSHSVFKCSVILLSVFVASWTWTRPVVQAQSLGRSLKANLDLPVSYARTTEEDEDSPELVELYGIIVESDGFVFVGGPTT